MNSMPFSSIPDRATAAGAISSVRAIVYRPRACPLGRASMVHPAARSAHRHDDLPEGVALPHPGQGRGHPVEGDVAVDVDAEVARDAEVSDGREVARPPLHDEYADPAAGG